MSWSYGILVTCPGWEGVKVEWIQESGQSTKYITKLWHFLFILSFFMFSINPKYMSQFEIERRSCGQSITNYRFFSCGGKNNLTGCNFFFTCLVRNLQKRWKKCPKSIQLWLCIRYCTDGLTLGHVQIFDQFLEVKLKHLEAR